MPKKTNLVKVASSLEQELLAAVVIGACSPTIVSDKELSKIGRIVHRAITDLCKAGTTPPVGLTTIYTHCISNLGAPEEDTRVYLRELNALCTSRDHKVLLKLAKQKEALVSILNEASKQLSGGDVQLSKFSELAEKTQDEGDELKPMSELGGDEPPMGMVLNSLPTITKLCRGIQGVWILGGREGVGKSTLALQIAIELQYELKVLYYDIDGTGETWMKYRIEQTVGKENYREASHSIYYRPSVTLDADLISTPAPALLVVDSIQTLPYEINQRRSSVDSWLARFKALTNKGYICLLISEMSREGEYKESSGINYAGSLNAELEASEGDDMLRFVVKKNRHGPRKGHIATLARNAQYPFRMEEV